MENKHLNTITLACHEINRQVKLAEQHQRMYYRDEPVQPARKGSSAWAIVWKQFQVLETLLHAIIASHSSGYTRQSANPSH